MNFRHLKIFITVCEEKNMTKAAKKLFISQPSVSQAIAEMEEYYQVRLFERLSRKIYLTKAGEDLLSYAYHLVALNQKMEEAVRKNGRRQTVVLGATVTIGTYVLPGLLFKLKEYRDRLEIKTVVENTKLIEGGILSSRLDLGLVEGEINSVDLEVKPFCEDELVLICHKDHPLAQKNTITLQDLQDQPFFVREEGSGSRALFLNAMKKRGVPVKIQGEFNNTEGIKLATLHNLGLGVVSKLSLSRHDHDLVILPVADLSLTRLFSLVYHKNKYISRELARLMEYIETNGESQARSVS
ncbi:MAG TPA: LysR family transcriptional regulator [Bacillota bacterium]